MKSSRRAIALLICVISVLLIPCTAFAAEYNLLDPFTAEVEIDGTAHSVRAYYADYRNNLYLSMKELAEALRGSKAQIDFAFGTSANDGDYFVINRSEPVADSTSEETYETRVDTREAVWLDLKRNRIFYNGADKKYYTYRDTENDLYMNLTDIQLLLDITAELKDNGGIILHTEKPFSPDVAKLNADGYFDYINGIVLGDATSGEILFSKNMNSCSPVASTSKLMSYLLIAQAMEEGRVSYTDSVPISQNAEKLSKSADGIIKMTAGTNIPFSELLSGMMVASSNECALALAEYVSGSEKDFVEQMNTKAKELGFKSSVFYNSNGLPVYTESALSSKRQNMMSAEELFELSSIILNYYPSVTEITRNQFVTLPTLEYTTANSNPLVFNIDGVTGLKTGSTKRAGYCLVASMPMDVGGENHNIVLVILGAENASERGQMSEILLRYAMDNISLKRT